MLDNTWCLLMSLSDNMWNDSAVRPDCTGRRFYLKLNTEKEVWDEVVDFAAANGINALLIDVGDGIAYKSHPEIAVEGAWTPEYMREEVKRLKKKGFAVYPKLNFSAAHDAWLGIYGRMLSTQDYYDVVRDLIHEVIDIFDTPELFHLGMNEEGEASQKLLDYACYRQYELFWHDMNFMFDCVREKGVRPWIWADAAWNDFEEFEKNVAKDVLVSPWYYNHMFSDPAAPLINKPLHVAQRESYKRLTEAGYDILPAGSNHIHNTYNLDHQIRFTRENAVAERSKGLLILTWRQTIERHKYRIFAALQNGGMLKKKYFGGEQ